MLRLDWRPRARPLAPQAMLAVGPAPSAVLRDALQALPDARRARLRAVQGPEDRLLVMGAAADLPWYDGADWLGAETKAPQLLLPTLYEPGVPPDLLQQACASRAPNGRRWLLWPQPALLWALQD